MIALAGLPEPADLAAGGELLHVRRLGQGPRLIWLHGGPGLDHHLLLPVALPLSERFEVWLPDLPGHGDSPPPHPGRLGVDEIRQRLGRWLSGIERERGPIDLLAGHSLGAWLAREALAERRLRAGGLILLSPPSGGRQRRSAVRRGLKLVPPAFHTAGPERDRARARRELLELLRADLDGEPSAVTRFAVGRSRVRPSWRYGKLLRQLHRAFVMPTGLVEPGCPTLVICGERDAVTPLAQAREIARTTVGARLEVLPEAGHFPFAADVAPLTRLIESFYSRSNAK